MALEDQGHAVHAPGQNPDDVALSSEVSKHFWTLFADWETYIGPLNDLIAPP